MAINNLNFEKIFETVNSTAGGSSSLQATAAENMLDPNVLNEAYNPDWETDPDFDGISGYADYDEYERETSFDYDDNRDEWGNISGSDYYTVGPCENCNEVPCTCPSDDYGYYNDLPDDGGPPKGHYSEPLFKEGPPGPNAIWNNDYFDWEESELDEGAELKEMFNENDPIYDTKNLQERLYLFNKLNERMQSLSPTQLREENENKKSPLNLVRCKLIDNTAQGWPDPKENPKGTPEDIGSYNYAAAREKKIGDNRRKRAEQENKDAESSFASPRHTKIPEALLDGQEDQFLHDWLVKQKQKTNLLEQRIDKFLSNL